jgi:hypothetical protein
MCTIRSIIRQQCIPTKLPVSPDAVSHRIIYYQQNTTMSSSFSDNDEVLSAQIIAAVEIVTCATGRAHRAGSRRGKAANRERFFADKTLQMREDYFIGEDVVRVDGGRGKRYTCSRNIDSNSRSLIPMTRYVTRCSQQVGKN